MTVAETPVFSFQCECLRDQGMTCGGDPIGHACDNNGDFTIENGAVVCKECLALLLEESPRVELPKVPLGIAGQSKIVFSFLAKTGRKE